MYKNKRTAVIIAAAGKGTRLGASMPKQFLKIGGEHILVKTIRAFERLDEIDYIFIVTSKEYQEVCGTIIKESRLKKVKAIVQGGAQRQDSVFNALQVVNKITPGVSVVLIHDAARPFVDEAVILNVLEAAYSDGASVACVSMKNSVRKLNETGSESVDRSDYYSVQTPQGFQKSILIDSYEKAFDDGFYGTDDASLVERAGYQIKIVDGDYSNIKITTKEDLPMENRVGTGFDVHRLVAGRKLIMGGIEIPYEFGLLGHSDADVLIHALMDALLGAAGMGDIGRLFPDTDSQYEGANSMKLLKHVKHLLDDSLYQIGNVDVTVIAQNPKLSPYIEQMREGIANVLDIDINRVNIKATTTEKLGFTGRGEGIACEAVASIYR